jgi:hypothetical protein
MGIELIIPLHFAPLVFSQAPPLPAMTRIGHNSQLQSNFRNSMGNLDNASKEGRRCSVQQAGPRVSPGSQRGGTTVEKLFNICVAVVFYSTKVPPRVAGHHGGRQPNCTQLRNCTRDGEGRGAGGGDVREDMWILTRRNSSVVMPRSRSAAGTTSTSSGSSSCLLRAPDHRRKISSCNPRHPRRGNRIDGEGELETYECEDAQKLAAILGRQASPAGRRDRWPVGAVRAAAGRSASASREVSGTQRSGPSPEIRAFGGVVGQDQSERTGAAGVRVGELRDR